MTDTPTSEACRPFEDLEAGITTGVWWVPVEGFHWRNDLQPAPLFSQDLVATGPWLVPVNDGNGLVQRYPVLRSRTLLEDFRALADTPTNEEIRQFAQRYGWLGVSHGLVPAPDGRGAMLRGESLSRWLDELWQFGILTHIWRDVAIIQGEAGSGAQVIAASERIAEQFRWKAGTIFYKLGVDVRASTASSTIQGFSHGVQVAPGDPEELLSRFSAGDVIGPAHYYLHQQVNRKLRGHVNLTVLPFRKGAVRLFPDSLLSAVYLLFAGELSKGVFAVVPCENCGLPLERRRRDQRFCDKNCREAAGNRRRRSDLSATRR